MSDNPNSPESSSVEDEATTAETVKDLLSTAKIPLDVMGNLIKAFGQLCSSTIDVPIAWLEGCASEIRASNKARDKSISTSGDQIAQQIKVDPQYAQIASDKFAQKIVREQKILDAITIGATQEILARAPQIEEPVAQESEEKLEINDDWLNAFEREATLKNTQEMQALFSRILAGEIIKPKSFSIKTIRTIGELDLDIAKIFQQLCSLCILLGPPKHEIFHAMGVTLKGRADQNGLKEFGLPTHKLIQLFEFGLISSMHDMSMDFSKTIIDIEGYTLPFPFIHNKRHYGLIKHPDNQLNEIPLYGVHFSMVGRELLPIVDVVPVEDYTAELMQLLDSHKFSMRECWRDTRKDDGSFVFLR